MTVWRSIGNSHVRMAASDENRLTNPMPGGHGARSQVVGCWFPFQPDSWGCFPVRWASQKFKTSLRVPSTISPCRYPQPQNPPAPRSRSEPLRGLSTPLSAVGKKCRLSIWCPFKPVQQKGTGVPGLKEMQTHIPSSS